MATQDILIKDLGLQPGRYKIKVSVDSLAYEESGLSNEVPTSSFIVITGQLATPTIYINDGMLYFLKVKYADRYFLRVDGESETKNFELTNYLSDNGQNILFTNLDQLPWYKTTESGEPGWDVPTGMKFIAIYAESNDTEIYKTSEVSNYLQYYVRDRLNAPSNLRTEMSVEPLTGRSDRLLFTPSKYTIEGTDYTIPTYTVYLNKDRYKTFIGQNYEKSTDGTYYLDLGDEIPMGIYKLYITAMPTKEIKAKYAESMPSETIDYITGGAFFLIDKDENIIIDSNDDFICVTTYDTVKKLTPRDFEKIRYNLEHLFVANAA